MTQIIKNCFVYKNACLTFLCIIALIFIKGNLQYFAICLLLGYLACGYFVNKYLNEKLKRIGKSIKMIKNWGQKVHEYFEKEQTFLMIEKLKRIELGRNYDSNKSIKNETEQLLLILREIESQIFMIGSFSKIKLGIFPTNEKNKENLLVYFSELVSKIQISMDQLMLNTQEEFSFKEINSKKRIQSILYQIENLRNKFQKKLAELTSKMLFNRSLLPERELKIVETANESLNKKTFSLEEAKETLANLDEYLQNISPSKNYPEKKRQVHIYTQNKQEVPALGKQPQTIKKEKVIEFDRDKFKQLLSVQIQRRIYENKNRMWEQEEKEAQTLEILKQEVEFNENLKSYSFMQPDEKDEA